MQFWGRIFFSFFLVSREKSLQISRFSREIKFWEKCNPYFLPITEAEDTSSSVRLSLNESFSSILNVFSSFSSSFSSKVFFRFRWEDEIFLVFFNKFLFSTTLIATHPRLWARDSARYTVEKLPWPEKRKTNYYYYFTIFQKKWYKHHHSSEIRGLRST